MKKLFESAETVADEIQKMKRQPLIPWFQIILGFSNFIAKKSIALYAQSQEKTTSSSRKLKNLQPKKRNNAQKRENEHND